MAELEALTARSVIGPKTPSAVMPSSRWIARTTEPRSPRFTITSLAAAAPPDALVPGSAERGHRGPREQRKAASRAHASLTTHGIENPCHQPNSLSRAYEVS